MKIQLFSTYIEHTFNLWMCLFYPAFIILTMYSTIPLFLPLSDTIFQCFVTRLEHMARRRTTVMPRKVIHSDLSGIHLISNLTTQSFINHCITIPATHMIWKDGEKGCYLYYVLNYSLYIYMVLPSRSFVVCYLFSLHECVGV